MLLNKYTTKTDALLSSLEHQRSTPVETIHSGYSSCRISFRHAISGLRFLLQLICGIGLGLFSGCNRQSSQSFNQVVKVHVGGSIWLWQTSKDVVTITDGEDVGVVYGNVLRIAFDPKNPGWLIVEYVPFESDSKFVKPSRVVRIKLNSAEVVEVEDTNGAIARGLADVRTFMKANPNTK